MQFSPSGVTVGQPFCNKYFTTFKEHWDWHNSGTKPDVKTEPYFENEDQSNDQYDDSIGQEDSYDIYHPPKEVRRKVSTYRVFHILSGEF